MNAFQRYRAGLATKASPNTVSPAIAESYTSYLEGTINPFLERFRSKAPSLVYMDKIAQCQNYAGAIYLPIAFAARQLSRSKVVIYQHDNKPQDLDGKKRIPRADPIYRLFTTDPNPTQTFSDILYSMSQQYDITGECYVWFPPEDSYGNYSQHGDPQEMYILPSAWVTGMPYGPYFTDGYYQVTPYLTQYPGGSSAYGSVYIPADQVMRLFDPNPLLDRTGMSVLQAISQAVDTVRSIDQSRASGQAQGCQQNLALELDPQFWLQGKQFDIEAVKQRFAQVYAGARNSGKAMVLPPGVVAKKISTQPEDMAWQEGWEQLTDFVFACYNTNRAALGMSGDLNFATLYASIKQLYWSKLEPRTEQFAARFNKDYFSPYVGSDYFCELELPVMDDQQQQLQGLAQDCKIGAITYGEYRMKRGYQVDPDTMPWLSERVKEGSAAPAGSATAGNQERLTDPNVEAARPRNEQGAGSLGPRIDEGKLLSVFENRLTQGVITNGKH